MNINRMPAAFDDAGHVDEVVVVTSELVRENCGRPLRSKLGALIFCGNKLVKKIAIDSGEALAAVVKTYTPERVSVVGGAGEHEIVEELERGIAMLLSIPPGATVSFEDFQHEP